jgi:hypothetical protein
MAESIARLLTSQEFKDLLRKVFMVYSFKAKDGGEVAVSLAEMLPDNLDHFNPQHMLEVSHVFMGFHRLRADTYSKFLRIQRNRKLTRKRLMKQLYNPSLREGRSATLQDIDGIPSGGELPIPSDIPIPKSLQVAEAYIETHPGTMHFNALNDEKEADFFLLDGACEGIKMYWETLRETRREMRGDETYAGEPRVPVRDLRQPRKPLDTNDTDAKQLRQGLKGFRSNNKT